MSQFVLVTLFPLFYLKIQINFSGEKLPEQEHNCTSIIKLLVFYFTL